ncbi:ABC transporter substrate-binding protein [Reyranella sp. MMS21-HV4-11]|uniref:ABC transporter substrate-binding protein n=1 Tax=Reyranella humidisoli TaxID=2849149 RepID=A0ABS6IG21_9HYPH|nr:ABC transporter substrate-binding protein [Reyranella sp. MMS21-HV4-11]MBU8872687.1 ABC transporter substrate-binding protein [Reyranella sp. MMS21-HV4-11]
MKRRTVLGLGAAAAVAALPVHAQQPPRVVSVGSSITEIIYDLGAEKLLVGVDTTSLYPEAARKLPQVGYMRALSAEGVLSLKPTLIIATTAAGPAGALDQLKATGIEIMILPDKYDYDSVVTKIAAIGKVTGKISEADSMIARGREAMKSLADRLATAKSHPRVLFLLSMSGGAPQAAGRDTAAAGIIKLAGGINAVDGYSGYRPLTPESVIASNADYVLVTRQTVQAMGGRQAILDQPSLNRTPAGKAGKIVEFDTLLLLGFGPRTPEAATELAMALHPDLVRAP